MIAATPARMSTDGQALSAVWVAEPRPRKLRYPRVCTTTTDPEMGTVNINILDQLARFALFVLAVAVVVTSYIVTKPPRDGPEPPVAAHHRTPYDLR